MSKSLGGKRHLKMLTVLFMCAVAPVFAQLGSRYTIGNFNDMQAQWLAPAKSNVMNLQVREDINLNVRLNVKRMSDNGDFAFYGDPLECNRANFYIDQVNGDFQGAFINFDNKKAYKFKLDQQGNLYSEEVDIHSLVCVDYDMVPAPVKKEQNTENPVEAVRVAPQLESMPGAPAVIYLDFDGETVSGSRWNNGNTINASAYSANDSQIQQIFDVVANDYMPYTVNVTTKRSVFNSASTSSRMMVIFTPTTTAAPGAGGVAYLSSFDDGRNDPCWVFNGPVQAGATTGSHEAGHTVGLEHDGVSGGSGYYGGNDLWGPIMGSPFNEKVMHWSKGDYPSADQSQDDLSAIDNNTGIDYKTDVQGGTIGTAADLVHTNGTVSAASNVGIIEKPTDKDMYKFTSDVGTASFTCDPDKINWPSLNVSIRLLNSSGTELKKNNTEDAHTVTNNISYNITTAGTYYLEIDGVGLSRGWTGSPHGYDDYGSLGRYYISGSFPAVINGPPITDFTASVTSGCGSLTVQFTDATVGQPTSWEWNFGDGSAVSTQQNPSHTYAAPGTYNVSLKATNANGNKTETKNSLIKVDPGAPYSSYTGGAPDNSMGAGGIFTASDVRGLFFDAHEDVILESFEFNSDQAGDRQIDIITGGTMNTTDGGVDGGTVAVTKTVNIPNGTNVVQTNIEVPAGNDYFIKITGATVNLYRNSAGASYPYVISDAQTNNLVTIKKANVLDGGDQEYYYYFYKWKVRQQGCDVNTGVVDEAALEDVSIYPNPAGNLAHVRFGQPLAVQTNVILMNTLGSVVYNGTANAGDQQADIATGQLPAGVYLLKLTSGEALHTYRLVVNH
ncbi:MAG: PKD domain-containing protein [Flavobacteriales bacterium]|nr:PKD domain-containing protein [Flavobacteriales bacterium]